MCGRYTLKNPDRIALAIERIVALEMKLGARFNVAPSQTMAAVARDPDGSPIARDLVWGFVPYWEQSAKPKIAPINAQAETAATKPMFRQALHQRRCLIPTDGFYEWRKDPDERKTPIHIELRDGRPFFFAGIWEAATDQRPATFAVLTTAANSLMATIHHRMPVILEDETARDWLNPAPMTAARLSHLASPFDPADMHAYPVSPLVNAPRYDGPECIERVPERAFEIPPPAAHQFDLF